jgi:hypothetical protein
MKVTSLNLKTGVTVVTKTKGRKIISRVITVPESMTGKRLEKTLVQNKIAQPIKNKFV